MAMFIAGLWTGLNPKLLTKVQSYNELTLSNGDFDSLKINKDDKETKIGALGSAVTTNIEPNPDNVILANNTVWASSTELYAQFAGNLEAGPLTFSGNNIDSFALKRASNRTGFKEWEDIAIIKANNAELHEKDYKVLIQDKIVENGVLYRYGVQPISLNKRGSIVKGPICSVVYEDIFIVGKNGQQLKIKYNPIISNYRNVIKETKIETIGSQFPYIIKNGSINYREFSLSGTITHFMDESNSFTDRDSLFIEDKYLMEASNYSDTIESLYVKNNLNDTNNPILEREFRNKVLTFLQDGEVKLFKSPTEGLMLVRITSVTTTPNITLGRMIYDFNCLITEVDSVTPENCLKYGIQI